MTETTQEGVTSDLLQADDLSEVVKAREESPKTDVPHETQKEEVKEPVSEEEKASNYQKAMKEERAKRKELQARIEAQERQWAERWQTAEQRLAMLQQHMQPQKEAPKYEDDPIEHLRQETLTTKQQLEQFHRLEAERQQQAQLQAQAQQLVGWAKNQTAEFSKEAADYNDAYSFVAQRRYKELEAMGLPQDQILATIQRDELWIINQSYQQGKNPAEVIYQMAMNTGYSNKPKQTEKMETLQKGVQASKSLGSGGPSNQKVTLEQLAAMSQEEFDAYCKANGGMEKVMSQARR